MALLVCRAINGLGRPADGLRIYLKCLETFQHERTFQATICADGFNSEWEFCGKIGLEKVTLGSFISDEKSTWHVVFSTGKYDGHDKTSFPLISTFCVLHKEESRIVTLTFSYNAYHIQTTVTHGSNSCAQMCEDDLGALSNKSARLHTSEADAVVALALLGQGNHYNNQTVMETEGIHADQTRPSSNIAARETLNVGSDEGSVTPCPDETVSAASRTPHRNQNPPRRSARLRTIQTLRPRRRT